MANKKPVAKVKPAAKKHAVKAKPAAKSSAIKKGTKYACSVCGLVVSVDTVCNCVEVCDLICCGKEMKTKK
ncbi:MAG TPA: hypothetical protein PLX02_04550 [Syntrophorhabdaceae bacterium]|nr:hypothetical protein [Syntrophorhabdaceae bacterium]HQM80871.1 hypothetical protein [Syntrophorhabdaceae bacterium]